MLGVEKITWSIEVGIEVIRSYSFLHLHFKYKKRFLFRSQNLLLPTLV